MNCINYSSNLLHAIRTSAKTEHGLMHVDFSFCFDMADGMATFVTG